MKVSIICIGKPKERFYADGIQEYVKRMLYDIEFLYIKQSDSKKESVEISRLCEKRKNIILLDERGKMHTSLEFAGLLKNEQDVVFVIGGPDGFSDELKKKYPKISLSLMTLPHEMALLVLVEQMYRAHMINSGRKYHRE